MPGGDGTGPQGLGPRTGRAAGYCAQYPVPGYANPNLGRGFYRGGGRGRRNLYYATGLTGWQRGAYSYPPPVVQAITKEQEAAELKNEAEYLENELKEIKKRIQEIGE
ncbi:MAG: hypothetical protein GQ469_07340 [Methanosarcinales archaeon]|nr:MAG: hypothetical protein C5S44_08930 [ANME-2 cluster archaeon]KAF5420713.1 MAG: hypothetical protein C5S45_04450 [ANME-2 cluster archaeon]MRG77497.1 hypothetical protein [ANME-2 cluster archaeon]NOR60427.1 hypothetical protein [Methanosarcinales archaeon]